MRHAAILPALLLLTAALPAAGENLRRPPGGIEGGKRLPWRDAGLTEAQAAAHLLDRFAYGARPGDVERVVEMGLETWLARQLDGDLPDPRVDAFLGGFKTLELSNREIAERYPNPGRVLFEARQAGVIDADADVFQQRSDGERGGENREQFRQVSAFTRQRGYRPQRELLGELMVQKLVRAAWSENQLTEVLTDFWFNHFNVSLTDNEARAFVPTYERDAIRPNVLGDFRRLLEATARHPAMLLYLDNARSVADEGTPRTFDPEEVRRRVRQRRDGGRFTDRRRDMELVDRNRPRGLNENYARELLELHTLGVDGGYTQDDVVAVARAFTGWTVIPPRRRNMEERVARMERGLARVGVRGVEEVGFVIEDDFLFRADAHDAGRKIVLGRRLPAGRGLEDGLEVLDLVAVHPSTARHLAGKIAVRFVSDDPPAGLVDRLAAVWLETGGDLRRVTIALAESPEFWSPEARRQKIKSPFELAISALRATDAEITRPPRELLDWISRMGQPLYAYQAPTGYPDRAEAWVNTGSLLTRMNFGLALATGRIPGVEVDLPALNGYRMPESLDAALETYVPLLLPQRDPAPTVSRLGRVIHDPELAKKIADASPSGDVASLDFDDLPFDDERGGRRPPWERGRRRPPARVDASPLAQVVGVILGSPEFQRR